MHASGTFTRLAAGGTFTTAADPPTHAVCRVSIGQQYSLASLRYDLGNFEPSTWWRSYPTRVATDSLPRVFHLPTLSQTVRTHLRTVSPASSAVQGRWQLGSFSAHRTRSFCIKKSSTTSTNCFAAVGLKAVELNGNANKTRYSPHNGPNLLMLVVCRPAMWGNSASEVNCDYHNFLLTWDSR